MEIITDIDFIELYANHDCHSSPEDGCSVCEEYALRFAPQYDEEWLAEAYLDASTEEDLMNDINGDRWMAVA